MNNNYCKLTLEDVLSVIENERNCLIKKIVYSWANESKDSERLEQDLKTLDKRDNNIRRRLNLGKITKEQAIKDYMVIIKEMFVDPLGVEVKVDD